MKSLTKTKHQENRKLLKKEINSLSTSRASYSPQLYSEKKTLNYKIIVLCLSLAVGSFFLGKQFNQSQHSFSVKNVSQSSLNYYADKQTDLTESQDYKEINFDSYIEKLNKKEFVNYRDYLAYKSYVYDLFKLDLSHNSKIFNSTHRITTSDRVKYIEFKHRQRGLSVKFRNALDKHQDAFKNYIRTKRKVSQL